MIKRYILTVTIFIMISIAFSFSKEYGVYEYVLTEVETSYEESVINLKQSALKNGWQVLAVRNSGTPDECNYRANVLVLYDSTYAEELMKINPSTAPFAITDRINLFEDEAGQHVSIVNPHSINRTMLMDDEKYGEFSEKHRIKLRAIITNALAGKPSEKQYGELRDEGYISRTMGVMAGGLFSDKIETILTVKDSDFKLVSEKLNNGLKTPGSEWGLHQTYMLELTEYKKTVFGINGDAMEAKSFDIVEEGNDDDREDFVCPGLAHAAAYPFQIVVTQDSTSINVKMVTSMFRMKIFFEDAGKWAFMKNMTMPGSLSDELTTMIKTALNVK